MIYAIVVIYNKNCEDSTTCKTLLQQKQNDFQVIVYDNSEKNYGNDQYCLKHNWVYLGGKGNSGLSKAYNAAVSKVKSCEEAENDAVCLLDDDTSLPDTFFTVVHSSLKNEKDSSVFVPVLTYNGEVISPWIEEPGTERHIFKSVEECLASSSAKLMAFNSCMVVRREVYNHICYDERLFLDGVDHAFCLEIRKTEYKIKVLNMLCEHGFSGKQTASFSSAVKRFQIYAKDMTVLYKGKRGLYLKVVGKRAIHLCLIYRKTVFLKILLKCVWKENKNER